ncbi:hypothetical protein AOLI_G00194280 [Acnodon oligacanthus]
MRKISSSKAEDCLNELGGLPHEKWISTALYFSFWGKEEQHLELLQFRIIKGLDGAATTLEHIQLKEEKKERWRERSNDQSDC